MQTQAKSCTKLKITAHITTKAMKVYIGSDHNGFHLRESLVTYLHGKGFDVEDEGDAKLDPSDDYPVFAAKVAQAVLASSDDEPRGILICGSGQGMCMAANRYKGIRAALGYDRDSVRLARHDDDANVLCLPARLLQSKETLQLVDLFLTTPFAAAPRFIRRIKEMDDEL